MLTQPQQNPLSIWLAIIRLLRWDKPAGRLILMVPALWAVFLAAKGTPPVPLVGVIILGTLATSAAGCVINDLWDRDIDPKVERTRDRPLASRTLSIQVGIGGNGLCWRTRCVSQFLHVLALRRGGACHRVLPLS